MTPTIQPTSATLDRWTREVVQWHFSPETGTPFWIERAESLDFDPLIRCYQDLDKFGFFENEWLRGGPVRRWVPRAYANKPIHHAEAPRSAL